MPRNSFASHLRPLFPLVAIYLAALVAASGCGSDNSSSPTRYVPVTLKAVGAGGSQAASVAAARGIPDLAAAVEGDTLPVTFTKAYLVVRDVRFKFSDDFSDTTGSDSDSTGSDEDFELTPFDDDDSTGVDEDDDRAWIRFRGPFVIDLLAGTADSLDTQMAPPGLYNRIQGHLRALRGGDWNASEFDFLIGSTVYLEGTVDGEGGGPFTWQSRIDNEFQIWGPFEVTADTPATAFLTFQHEKWLRGRDGSFLDPRVEENHKWIEWAIRHNIKFDMDDDHDGEPDDD